MLSTLPHSGLWPASRTSPTAGKVLRGARALLWLALSLGVVLSGPVAQAKDDRCRDSEFAARCAGTCAPWCQDAVFFVEHQDFCLSESVHGGSPQDASADCSGPPPDPTVLDQCLTEAKRNARTIEEKIQTLGSEPALMEALKERLKGVPNCAPDSPTLIRMFKCLEDEGGRIESTYSELEARGYTKLTDLTKLCAISRDEMKADFTAARSLGAEAKRLQEIFQRINACKTEFEQWGERATDASDTRWSGGGLIQVWINQIREDLEPTAQMAAKLDVTIAETTKQTASIIDSVGQAIVICP